MLPLWGWYDCRLGVRQHPGCRACQGAGGCPDALAREGQPLTILVGWSGLVLTRLALAQAIAFAIHLKDVHMVGQSIQQRAGQTY